MNYPNDRRKHEPATDEMLSPEYLAMLMACGGEVRAEDRDALDAPSQQDRRRRRDDAQPPPRQDAGDTPRA